MAYLNTIPAANDILALSQAQILENFSQLETQFSVDHDSLLAGAATGKHLKVTLPERAAPATGAGEGAIYTKDTAGQPELFYREESNGDEVQLTSMGMASGGYVKGFVFFDSTGAIQGTAFNIASVTRTGTGVYNIVFTNNLTDANYVVTTGSEYDTPLLKNGGDMVVRNKAVGGFTIESYLGSGSLVDRGCNVTVFRT
jgi:hypothetical protein